MRILCMSSIAKLCARHCKSTFRIVTGSRADVLRIVTTYLGDGLGHVKRDQVSCVIVVASKDVEFGTCTIRTLKRTGYVKSGRGNGVILLREAIKFCLIDRAALVLAYVAKDLTWHASVGGLNSKSSRPPASFPGSSCGTVGTAQWLTQSECHSPDARMTLVNWNGWVDRVA